MTENNREPESGNTEYREPLGNAIGAASPSSTSTYPDRVKTGTRTDDGYALDDTDPIPATGSRVADDEPVFGDRGERNPGLGLGGDRISGAGDVDPSSTDTTEKAKQVAGHAVEQAADVKDEAIAKASEVKDVALERGADVATVAKDELVKLTGEARAQVQDLWSQASSQLREQVDTGRHQLADLLHSLADELGEMASKSTQTGPVTSLAKQAAHRGGELSHWLANTEPSALMNDIRRFARRRPVVFFGGAALAGVLVGRLGRGLMAAGQDSGTSASGVSGTKAYGSYGSDDSAPATSGTSATPPASMEAPNLGSDDGDPTLAGYPAEARFVQPLASDPAAGGLR